MSTNKIFKCPFCIKRYIGDKGALMTHMCNVHNDELHNLPPEQVYFNYTNRYALTKGYGKSIVSNKPTKFNIVTCRYEKFADENDLKLYKQMIDKRMENKYGTKTLLNDINHQAKMLANRGISGTYSWGNGKYHTYTGTYEKKFLEYLDTILGWENPDDIIAPAPQKIVYKDGEGRLRSHLPDFYITSLNLVVNIKSKTNQHYRLRDIESELKQDEVLVNSGFNYIKIFDNDFKRFSQAMDLILKNGKLDSKKFIK